MKVEVTLLLLASSWFVGWDTMMSSASSLFQFIRLPLLLLASSWFVGLLETMSYSVSSLFPFIRLILLLLASSWFIGWETMISSASSLFQFIIFPRQSWEQQLERPQILAQRLAAAVAALQFLQFVLYHRSARRGAWAAYYGPVPVAALGVAVMLRFPCPLWLPALFFAAGQADTVAAYSLQRGGDLQCARHLAKRGLPVAYLAVALFRGDGATVARLRWKEVLCLALGVLVVLQDLKIRHWAMTPPSEICKAAAGYVSARGGARPVAAEDDNDPPPRLSVVAVGSLESSQSAMCGCTTLEDIAELHLPARRRSLEDACLSSALFLQLLQRYGHGHDDHRSQRPRTLQRSSANHAFRDALLEGRWKRAFRLVEQQLAFTRDYFFSTHGGGSPSRSSYWLYQVYSFLKVSFLLSVRSLAMEEEPGPLTSATIYALALLELRQLFSYLNSNWFQVAHLCDQKEDVWAGRVVEEADPDEPTLVSFLTEELGLGWTQGWLGQYSIVEDFDGISSCKHGLMGSLAKNMDASCEVDRPALGSIDRSSQLGKLKRWICGKLVDAEPSWFASDAQGTRLWVVQQSTPSSSSSQLDADDLSWTLDPEATARTILIWHVATWFCDMSEDVKLLVAERVLPAEYTFATMLSGYCAYLVAARPELLPEHRALTSSIFKETVKSAGWAFRGQTSPGERYKMMKARHEGVFGPGMKLALKLVARSSSERWKVMADFWAEMTLFLAQSGSASAHIEQLVRGPRELVTLLWALLSNGCDRSFVRRSSNDDGDTSLDDFSRIGHQVGRSLIENVVGCLLDEPSG